MWRNAAGSLATIVPPPDDAQLWYDDRGIAFLREDAKDAADIEQIKAETITGLVKEGFTWKSAIAAVVNQNMSLLEHTGLISVQLQPPGTTRPALEPGANPNVDPAGPPALPPAGGQ